MLKAVQTSTSSIAKITKNLAQAFDEAVTKYHHRDALRLVAGKRRWTFIELKCELWGNAMVLQGYRYKWPYGCSEPLNGESILIHLGCAKAGNLFVPVGPLDNDKFTQLVDKLELTGIVMSPRINDLQKLREIIPELQNMWNWTNFSSMRFPNLREIVHTDFDSPGYQGFITYKSMISSNRSLGLDKAPQIEPDAPAITYITASDDTNYVKETLTYTHNDVVTGGDFIGQEVGFGKGDRVNMVHALTTNFAHAYGLWSCFLHGAQVAIPGPSFNAEKNLSLFYEEKNTGFIGGVDAWEELVKQRQNCKEDISTFKKGLIIVDDKQPTKQLLNSALDAFKLSTLYSYHPQSGLLFNEISGIGKLIPNYEGTLVANNAAASAGTVGELKIRSKGAAKDAWRSTNVSVKLDKNGDFVRG